MSLKLDEKLIHELADDLEIGLECFYHLPTGTFESHPDMGLGEVEPEAWPEVIN